MVFGGIVSCVVLRLLPACKRNICVARLDFGLSHVCSFIGFDCGGSSNFHAGAGSYGPGITVTYSVTSAHTGVAEAPYNQFVNHFLVEP